MKIVKSSSTIGDQEIEIYIQVDDKFQPQDEDMLFRDDSGKKILTATSDLFGEGLKLTRNCAAKVIESVNKMGDNINTVAKLRGFNGCRSIVNTTKRRKLGKNLG